MRIAQNPLSPVPQGFALLAKARVEWYIVVARFSAQETGRRSQSSGNAKRPLWQAKELSVTTI